MVVSISQRNMFVYCPSRKIAVNTNELVTALMKVYQLPVTFHVILPLIKIGRFSRTLLGKQACFQKEPRARSTKNHVQVWQPFFCADYYSHYESHSNQPTTLLPI